MLASWRRATKCAKLTSALTEQVVFRERVFCSESINGMGVIRVFSPRATTAGLVMSNHTSNSERQGASRRSKPPSTFHAHHSNIRAHYTQKTRSACNSHSKSQRFSHFRKNRAMITPPVSRKRQRPENAARRSIAVATHPGKSFPQNPGPSWERMQHGRWRHHQ